MTRTSPGGELGEVADAAHDLDLAGVVAAGSGGAGEHFVPRGDDRWGYIAIDHLGEEHIAAGFHLRLALEDPGGEVLAGYLPGDQGADFAIVEVEDILAGGEGAAPDEVVAKGKVVAAEEHEGIREQRAVHLAVEPELAGFVVEVGEDALLEPFDRQIFKAQAGLPATGAGVRVIGDDLQDEVGRLAPGGKAEIGADIAQVTELRQELGDSRLEGLMPGNIWNAV